MIKLILFLILPQLLTACSESTEEAIPHNRITQEANIEESVTFAFEDTNRFNNADFNLGRPKIQLMNGTYSELETDFKLSVDRYDDGWQEIDTINYYVKNYPYTLNRETSLTYSLFADHFSEPLDSGRYRLILDYSLVDEEASEDTFKIGAVFWIED